MSDLGSSQSREGSSSFFQPLNAVLAGLSSALHTRRDLFVPELEEERERIKQALVFTLLLLFGFSFGIVLLTIFLVALFWQNGWIAAIGGLALAYFARGRVCCRGQTGGLDYSPSSSIPRHYGRARQRSRLLEGLHS